MPRSLLRMGDLSAAELRVVLDLARELKRGSHPPLLAGRVVAMLFQKPSLRTRLSFEVGIHQLGAHCVSFAQHEVGLGTREPVQDVARVLGRMADAIVARVFAQADVDGLARWSGVPVVNALSDEEHPCQTLADLLTIQEQRGCLEGQTVCFVGDGNNVACSLMVGCALAGVRFRMAVPAGYEPPARVVSLARSLAGRDELVEIGRDPLELARGADVLYTDVWTSMGQEEEMEERRLAFAGYQINRQLLEVAAPDAIVMHDLPAHRGEEIAEDVIEGPRSVVFDQAENRLHAQKAILTWLLAPERVPEAAR